MDADDKRERQVEVTRGHHAKQILDNPVWDTTFLGYETSLREWIESPETVSDDVLEARRMLIALRRLRRDIETTMQTGHLAEMQLRGKTNE